MAIKLLKEEPIEGIPVWEMKDGEIGVIVAWGYAGYIGRVVQRCKSVLINIGMESNRVWDDIDNLPPTCRVRVLEKGEKLVIT